MIYASRCVDLHESLNGAQYDEDSAVFFLELLIKVVLQNRSAAFLCSNCSSAYCSQRNQTGILVMQQKPKKIM